MVCATMGTMPEADDKDNGKRNSSGPGEFVPHDDYSSAFVIRLRIAPVLSHIIVLLSCGGGLLYLKSLDQSTWIAEVGLVILGVGSLSASAKAWVVRLLEGIVEKLKKPHDLPLPETEADELRSK